VLLSEKISSILVTYTILSIATTVLPLSARVKRIFGLLEINFFVDENAERILCSILLLYIVFVEIRYYNWKKFISKCFVIVNP